LKSSKVQSVIENNNVGLIIPHFKKEFLDRIEIPILPMSEQIKIGDTLHNIDIQIQGNKDMCHKLQLNDTTTSCFSMKGEMRYAS
jgi:type I restriction enzyme S subunit